VLTDRTRFLKPRQFEKHLQIMGVASRRAVLGDYQVYYEFSAPSMPAVSCSLPENMLKMDASHGQAGLHKLTDGDYRSRWTTRALQQNGMWLDIELPRVYTVNRLTLDYGPFHQDRPAAINLLARTGGGWQTVAADLPATLDKFTIRNGQPVYDELPRQTIAGVAVRTDALRLEISRPRSGQSWTMTQLEVGVADLQDAPSAE
jgi:hypothetical protein